MNLTSFEISKKSETFDFEVWSHGNDFLQTESHEIFFWGNHRDSSFDNEVYSINLKTSKISAVYKPFVGQSPQGFFNKKASNMFPASRTSTALTFDSSRNLLFLFGGVRFSDDTANDGVMNDLWSFSITSGKWVLLSGQATPGAIGKFPQQLKKKGKLFQPPARFTASTFISGDYFYVFGGGANSAGSVCKPIQFYY